MVHHTIHHGVNHDSKSVTWEIDMQFSSNGVFYRHNVGLRVGVWSHFFVWWLARWVAEMGASYWHLCHHYFSCPSMPHAHQASTLPPFSSALICCISCLFPELLVFPVKHCFESAIKTFKIMLSHSSSFILHILKLLLLDSGSNQIWRSHAFGYLDEREDTQWLWAWKVQVSKIIAAEPGCRKPE